jgi:cellulose synthase/poly-beta-1,6-N-acetylglucosamine synthase-like glycosyltransferase
VSSDTVRTAHEPVPRMPVPARRARLGADARIASWAFLMSRPVPESARSRRLAHLGGLAAVLSLSAYLAWRIGFTLPDSGWDQVAAWILVVFEAVPLAGILFRTITLWNIDRPAPDPVYDVRPGRRVAVFIPTYNEPVEVIAPTIAASVALEPAHETWVLDDGDRPWVEQMCREYGARYVRREVHDHAKAGNMNHALALMAREDASGAEPIDIIAVLDCDHVPMPTFLTDTIGWFDDPRIALVQGPQAYYNAGAFDDDGETGEQGVFFHVLMAGRNHDGAGPFWCGSTSLIRASALREVGGIATETIVEDMHTTLRLLRRGWKTVFHHQTLAVGLAPATPEQYLLQRRRWGMGSMQVLTTERLWAAKRWLSWRNFYEYLSGTVWWLEGVGTVLGFLIPAVILVSGATTSTAHPAVFLGAFLVMFLIRLWGVKRLFRGHLQWTTAFALRILRIPVGLSCLWWLVTRRDLKFQVTPKAGADERLRGRAPRVLWLMLLLVGLVLLYALAGLTGLFWRTTLTGAIASAVWLLLAGFVLVLSILRIQGTAYATSRRNAHRVPISATVSVDGVAGELVDLSVGGAAVRFPRGSVPVDGTVELTLPGAAPVPMQVVRVREDRAGRDHASLRVREGDWAAYRTVSMWLFHTPPGVVEGIPFPAPAVAALDPTRQRQPRVLARQHG